MRPIITTTLFASLLLAGCESNDNKITEMHVDDAGNIVQGASYTRDELWMRQVDETIHNESLGQKPVGGSVTWEQFWRNTYKEIRAQSKAAWHSTHFKTSEDMVTYIKQERTAKKLPLYDDH